MGTVGVHLHSAPREQDRGLSQMAGDTQVEEEESSSEAQASGCFLPLVQHSHLPNGVTIPAMATPSAGRMPGQRVTRLQAAQSLGTNEAS